MEWVFESNLRSFGYLRALEYFGFFWTPAAKVTCLQELAGNFRSSLLPNAQNRAFAKKWKLYSIPKFDPGIIQNLRKA